MRWRTLLATSRAFLRTPNGDLQVVRLLLDQGSELTFISEDLVQRYKMQRHAASIPLRGVGGTFVGRTRGIVSIYLQSIHDASSHCTLGAYILTRLTAKLPHFENARCHLWPHVDGLPLADPEFGQSGPINIIIGSDAYGAVLMPGLARGDSLSPVAQQTIFGWVLSGPIAEDRITSTAPMHHCTLDQELKEILNKFWEQEEAPANTVRPLNPEEEECEQHFLNTHSRDQAGRYIVRLPLKSDSATLRNSSERALRILSRLSHRLNTDPEYKQLYMNFVEEYKSLGHMVPVVPAHADRSPIYYLPHHGVKREDNRTTKLRVVFNGSSRTTNGISLNDLLHPGAKLQEDIADVLLWSRKHRFIFSTDIEKMYRQIAVHPEDWNLQRIFWFDQENRPAAFHLTTVTYGLNCAPYLALRALKQLVSDEGHRFPKAVPSMTRDRYVDDIFGGADSESEVKEILEQLILLCEAGKLPLQKWSSNLPGLVPNSTRGPAASVEFEPTLTKILGLVWKPISDTFHFQVKPSPPSAPTKRAIASDIAKLYDPLGLISPVLIQAKVLLQELWLHKVGWDDPLPLEICLRWTSFREQLNQLDQLAIPRWLNLHGTHCTTEMHGFSDASQLAMAAAVYVRVADADGRVSVRLVCSKTRVAPLKRLTIPRLELAAALLLARLMRHSSEALDLQNVPLLCWTDSSVTYTWITSHPSRWKDFVRNRVSMIQEILPHAAWRYVPGKENPADCASRGLRPGQLAQHEIWWKGPRWLSGDKASWPSTSNKPTPNTSAEERPGTIVLTTTSKPDYWDLLDRYSSLTKLIRVTATCRRVLLQLKHLPNASPKEYPLTPMELEQSRNFWVRSVQRAWFPNEIRVLSLSDQLSRSNPLWRLVPFIDRHGLLRVGGRLHNANMDPESKHPLILPQRSPLTTLIVDDGHHRTLHGGTQVTLGFLRTTYWIVGGRAPVRSHILKCVRCARYRAVRAQQLMGQLPSARVNAARPFLNSGLDYAGPITLKTWRGRAARSYKGYLAIFICLATSATHLELVTDYTTDAFLAAYRRFTGRRGICATLHSDCGTNFIGADADLRRLFNSASNESRKIASLLANDGTQWKFNPPVAPHFGGKWEAAVKSTKHHLRRVLKDTVLTYEELTTLLAQIEAVLNSRPLCPLSEDATDYVALTPGHFLIGEAPTLIPEPTLMTEPSSRLSRWQLLQQKTQHFWSRWSSECLQRYLAISKWPRSSNEIKIGSLVLITDERYPPGKWPLARVTQLHPGPDGLVRVVTVKTAAAIYKRPITNLCVLPTKEEDYSSILSSKAGGNVTNATPVTDARASGRETPH